MHAKGEMGMDFLKEFFESEEAFDKFSEAVRSKGMKLADLSGGDYVSAKKASDNVEKAKRELRALHEAELKALAAGKTAEADEKRPPEGGAETADLKKQYEELQKSVEDLRRKNESAEKKAAFSEARAKYLASGGRAGLADDLVAAMLRKSDETRPFDAVLETYKKEHPDIFIPPKTTAPTPPLAGGDADKAEAEKTRREIRARMGLKTNRSGIKDGFA
jgi:hypothetical protein